MLASVAIAVQNTVRRVGGDASALYIRVSAAPPAIQQRRWSNGVSIFTGGQGEPHGDAVFLSRRGIVRIRRGSEAGEASGLYRHLQRAWQQGNLPLRAGPCDR